MAQAKGSTKTAANVTSGAYARFWTGANLDRRMPLHWGFVDGTDGAQTLTLNACTILPALTASRNCTLPVINAKWDRCWVMRPVGSATLDAVLLCGAGNTCVMPGRASSVAAGAEITRLFNAGEWMGFVAYSSTAWMLDIGGDGRKACFAYLSLSTASTGNSAATYTYPTDASGVWTATRDSGGIATAATGTITARRTGRAFAMVNYRTQATVTDVKYYNTQIIHSVA